MHTSCFLFLLLPLAFSSCSSEPQADKAQDLVVEGPAADATRTDPMNFAAPEGWTERTPTAAMRHKEFVLGELGDNPTLVIVAQWKNGVGGLQANLQRWKGQVGGGEGATEPTIDTLTENGLISTILDGQGAYSGMSGETQSGSRLMAAYIESPSGRMEGVYTIKLSGPSDSIEPWAESFRKFIQDL
jgi:hypothetical protein